MKRYPKIFNLFILFLTLVALVGTTSCNSQKVPKDVEYYTCPMHPQIRRDQPGQCPICDMTLVPVKKEGSESQTSPEHAGHPAGGEAAAPSTPSDPGKTGMKGIMIDPARTQLIGVQTAEVEYRDLTKNLLIQGKAAFDPKLWIAQKEYFIALKLGDRSLIRSAEEKLYFMGLSKEWIRILRKSRNADLGFFVPDPKKPTFLEAFINQSDLKMVHSGQEVEIYDIDSSYLGKGVIRALGTMVDMKARTVRALVQSDESLNLKSNTFVQIKIELNLGKRLAVPKRAVMFNGDHNMVYVETDPGHFLGKKIELGVMGSRFYEIKEGLSTGEKVVTNGQFLVDSETKLKMGGSGGHQH
jgi:Cu(I)/Ag(I) efflux system membrane fusion protein